MGFWGYLAAAAGGCVIGWIFVYARVLGGLTAKERVFLRCFYEALRAGSYEDRSEDAEE